MKEKTLETLVEAGSDLIERARTYSFKTFQKGDVYIMHDLIAVDFRDWKENVIKYLKHIKNNETAILNINNFDTLFIDTVHWATKAIDPKTKQEAIKLYIENVGKIIKELSHIKSPHKKMTSIKKIDIDKAHLTYDENKSIIVFNDLKIQIPPNSKESMVCKRLFKMSVGDRIAWDEFYAETGEEEEGADNMNSRMLKDAIRRANGRLLKHFKKGSKIAEFQKHEIVRLH